MPDIIEKKKIAQILAGADRTLLLSYIEKAYTWYSEGKAVVPPVGTLGFEHPPGDVHIKYGYIRDEPIFVIKIASGFYENPGLGLSSSNGLNLVFSQKTGELQTILLDEGLLTDVRTALGGAVAAKTLAPPKITGIGIVGTGIQAKWQLEYLRTVTDCRNVYVWGRTPANVEKFRSTITGFDVHACQDIDQVSDSCNLIVTTTPSTSPLLRFAHPGTLITAIGADTIGKQELNPSILEQANLIVMDSESQCRTQGEIHQSLDRINCPMMELGDLLADGFTRDPAALIVADLTGVATQDIQISKFILDHLD